MLGALDAVRGRWGGGQTELRQVRPESVQGACSMKRTGTKCKPKKKKCGVC